MYDQDIRHVSCRCYFEEGADNELTMRYPSPGEPEGRCMGAVNWDPTKASTGESMHEGIIFDVCDSANVEEKSWQVRLLAVPL
jgi:hypothetical protein